MPLKCIYWSNTFPVSIFMTTFWNACLCLYPSFFCSLLRTPTQLQWELPLCWRSKAIWVSLSVAYLKSKHSLFFSSRKSYLFLLLSGKISAGQWTDKSWRQIRLALHFAEEGDNSLNSIEESPMCWWEVASDGVWSNVSFTARLWSGWWWLGLAVSQQYLDGISGWH